MPGSIEPAERQFHGRLARTTLLILLLITLVPLVVVGGTTYLRTRGLLREQIFSLMSVIVQVQGQRISEEIASARQLLTRAVVDTETNQALHAALAISDRSQPEYIATRNQFFDQLQIVNQPRPYFNQFIVVKADGVIHISTKRSWEGLKLGSIGGTSSLSRQASSRVVFDFNPLYPQDLVILTTIPYLNAEDELLATIVGISEQPAIRDLMDRATFFTRNTYFVPANGIFYGVNPYSDSFEKLIQYPPSQELNFFMEYLGAQPEKKGVNELITFRDEPEIAAYTWLPDLQAGWLAEIPQASVYGQVNSLLVYGGILLAVVFIILGLIVWQVTRFLVHPLTRLAGSVAEFSSGNWYTRAEVNRNDELGLLADSFNKMAADLAILYQSLESKVAERTRQLQTAGELSQLSSSATDLDELLLQTVKLLANRFGFPFAAVYLLDEANEYAVLRQAVAPATIMPNLRGARIKVQPLSLVGWVALAGSTKVDLIGQGAFGAIDRPDLAPEVRAEAGIPIIHSGKVLGVLALQSIRVTQLNEETIKELQNLASQIGPALQNFYLLEATQIDLEETNLLYQASHQIAQAETAAQVLNLAKTTLHSTPYSSALLIAKQDHFDVIWNSNSASPGASAETLNVDPGQVNLQLTETGPIIGSASQKQTGLLPNSLVEWLKKYSSSTLALIPVRRTGELKMILVLGSGEQDARSGMRFSRLHLQPYTNLVELMTNTLEKVNALEATNKRLSEMEILNNLSREVAQQTNLEALFGTIYEYVTQIFGKVDFLLARYDTDAHQIQVPYAIEEGQRLFVPAIPFGKGLTSLVIRSRKALRLVTPEDWRTLPAGSVAIFGKDAVSWLGAPMIVGGEVVGVIVVQDVHQSQRFSQDDETFFSTLATQLAVVIRNMVLLETTRQRAYTESLVNEITGNIRRSLSIPDILATTTTELGRALRVRKAKISVWAPQSQALDETILQEGGRNGQKPGKAHRQADSREDKHGD